MATTSTPAPAAPTTSKPAGPAAPRCGDTRAGALRIGDGYFNARHDRIEVQLTDGTWARVSTPKEIRAAAAGGMAQVRITPAGYTSSVTMDVPASSMHGKGGPVQVTSTDPAPLVAAVWHGLATGKGSATVTIPDVHGAALTLGHARNDAAKKHLVEASFPDGSVVRGSDRDPASVEYLARFLAQGNDPTRWDRFVEHPIGQQIAAQLGNAPRSALIASATNEDTWEHLARRRDLSDDVVLAALNSGAAPGLFVAAASPLLRRRIVDSVELALLTDDPTAVTVVTNAFLAAADEAEGTAILARFDADQLRRFALAHPDALSTSQVDRFFVALGPDVALALDNVDRRAIDLWVKRSADGDALTAVLANPSLSAEQRRAAYQRLAEVVGPAEAARRDREALDRRLRDPEVSRLLNDTTPDAVRDIARTDPEKAVLFGNRESFDQLSDDELLSIVNETGMVPPVSAHRLGVLAGPDRIEHWAAVLGPAGVRRVVDAVFADPSFPPDQAASVLREALITHSRIAEPPEELLRAASTSPHPEVHDVVVAEALECVRSGAETRVADGHSMLAALAANRDLSPENLALIAAVPGFTGHATLVAGDPARVAASLTHGVRSPSHLAAVSLTAAYGADQLDDTSLKAVREGLLSQGVAVAAARPQALELVALCRLHVQSASEFSAQDLRYSAGRETFALVQTAMREAVRSGEPGLAWSYANALRNDEVLAVSLPGLLPLFDKAFATEMRGVSVHQQAQALATSSRDLHGRISALTATIEHPRWSDVPMLPFRQRVRRQLAEQLAREVDQVEQLVEDNAWVFSDPRLAAPGGLTRSQAAELRASIKLFASWRKASRSVIAPPPGPATRPTSSRRRTPQRRR